MFKKMFGNGARRIALFTVALLAPCAQNTLFGQALNMDGQPGNFLQPSADDFLLGMAQFGRPALDRPGDQARLARLSKRRDPTPHRTWCDAEELGDLLDRVSLQDTLDGQAATTFQFRRSALVSHP